MKAVSHIVRACVNAAQLGGVCVLNTGYIELQYTSEPGPQDGGQITMVAVCVCVHVCW